MKKLVILGCISLFMLSCGSTSIEKSWHEPGMTISNSAENKTFVIALVKDETSRRIIEDILVQRLNKNAEVSYNAISLAMLKNANVNALDDELRKGKFTHVLMMRLADIEKETSYVEGTSSLYYGGYGRYYSYGAGFYSTPGYYTTDKNYFVETTIYSVNQDKLIWSCTSKTVNPTNIDKTVNEIADVVAERMRKDGFLK
jgi:hypothetical protein